MYFSLRSARILFDSGSANRGRYADTCTGRTSIGECRQHVIERGFYVGDYLRNLSANARDGVDQRLEQHLYIELRYELAQRLKRFDDRRENCARLELGQFGYQGVEIRGITQ